MGNRDNGTSEQERLVASYKKRRKKYIIRYIIATMGVLALIVMLSVIKNSKVDNIQEPQNKEAINKQDTLYTDFTNVDDLLTSNKPVILALGAEWCEPCKRFNPILEDIKKELGDSVIIKIIDVDENPQFSSQYPLIALPTQVLYSHSGVAYNPKNFIGVNNFKMYKENSDDTEPSLTMHQGEMTKSETLTVLNDMQSVELRVDKPVSEKQLQLDERKYSTQLHSEKYLKDKGVTKIEGSINEEDNTRYQTINGR